ncbi:hypothetical protein C5167_003273 [Papaver somniferum]|uniref:Uncharacterized protein n=1 Tax=Papaver somniferum TaxID=3469 RepID=A0A4Y7L0I9_PAPSO|nr:hypothetical protein C5167_003273 [Papaver somniferum]
MAGDVNSFEDFNGGGDGPSYGRGFDDVDGGGNDIASGGGGGFDDADGGGNDIASGGGGGGGFDVDGGGNVIGASVGGFDVGGGNVAACGFEEAKDPEPNELYPALVIVVVFQIRLKNDGPEGGQ